MMTGRDRIFPSMNAANGPPPAVVLLPICTSNATHPSTLVSVYVPWQIWVKAYPTDLRLEYSLEYPPAARKRLATPSDGLTCEDAAGA